VRFINDSKATSVDATMKALEAFADNEGKVVLILGGKGKQAPYSPLVDLIKAGVRRMILIGEDAKTIESEIGDAAPFEHAAQCAMRLPGVRRRQRRRRRFTGAGLRQF
jgi:UDP-N-acetylmuramoylalanine--D-glutamate ligase